ncbi:MAG: SRPBCC family protein [Deltaproteobacteria bacterium]|nr:SRPBCC family protein [Deltaproteobacteria bacterium]
MLVIAALVTLVAAELPDAERLARGEVVLHFSRAPGSDFPVATAHVLVDASPERVWRIVSDCERTGEVMPDVLTSAVVPEGGQSSRCTVVVDLPFPLSDLRSVTRAVLEVQPGRRWQRSWQLLAGDFTVNEGYWRVEPTADGRTLATYHIDVRPTVPLPSWLVSFIQRAKLPEMMERLRAVARSA